MSKKLLFLFFAPLVFLCACKSAYRAESITAVLIPVDSAVVPDEDLSQYLRHYRDSLTERLDDIIAFSDAFVDKKVQEEQMGAWFADAMKAVFKAKYGANYPDFTLPDMALFNSGGMRTAIPEEDVPLSFVYEFMPFDNRFALVELSGDAMQEMFEFLAQSKIRHPLSGLRLTVRGNKPAAALIGGKAFDKNKTYTVLTSDFLLFGGDNMTFFSKNIKSEVTGVLIRDAMAESLVMKPEISMPEDARYVTF